MKYIIVIITLVLAGIAIFTGIKLFQTREGTITPNAPTSLPAAATIAPTSVPCLPLVLTVAAGTAAPTASPTATATASPTTNPTTGATTTPQGTASATTPPVPVTGNFSVTAIGVVTGLVMLLASLALIF